MPLTRIDLPKGKPAEYRAELREIVYETLVQTVNVPADDRHEVVAEHDPENLNLDPNFLGIGRSAEAILIQITFNEGRTVEQKQAFYAALVKRLHERLGIRPQDVTINLVEVKKENWSFGNGIAQYVEQG
jgi:phenylpyruvate tautomerase PptA (4-oxalocrotonate tautomerase family)